MRAVTLAALAPRPGELLWDVGAGSGSVAIEWCLAGTGCRAVAFERDEQRRARIADNARTFGVVLDLRAGAPESFASAPAARGDLRRRRGHRAGSAADVLRTACPPGVASSPTR